ncbi:MAG: hypothetical protein LBU94_05565 [Clostridiales bacterium]|jgi:hypothetical protein|nr:hypothetical protein [Clostridiales bacterium]
MRKKQIKNRMAQIFYKPTKKSDNKGEENEKKDNDSLITYMQKIDEELDKRVGSVFGKRKS